MATLLDEKALDMEQKAPQQAPGPSSSSTEMPCRENLEGGQVGGGALIETRDDEAAGAPEERPLPDVDANRGQQPQEGNPRVAHQRGFVGMAEAAVVLAGGRISFYSNKNAFEAGLQ